SPLGCSRERQRKPWSDAPSPSPRRWPICPVRKVQRSRSSTAASCALGAAQIFDGVDIPAGSILYLTDTPHRIERFALPALTSPFRAFGLDLPPEAEVSLCRERWEVDQVRVPDGAYVEIAGAKLAGF